MKKFLCILFTVLITLTMFCACEKKPSLFSYVSELKSDEFTGESENYKIKATYGFYEVPKENDGKVGNRAYTLSFKLPNKETENATYVLSLTFNEKIYKAVFKLNPVSNNLCAYIELDGFNLKSFDVTLFCGADAEKVTLLSIVPDTAMNYETALSHLYIEQKDLIDNYFDKDGNFTAELYARIIVKDDKPYWYFGIATGNDNLKALLIDGITGEVLAIREVF